jgi:outer membrane protein TolC
MLEFNAESLALSRATLLGVSAGFDWVVAGTAGYDQTVRPLGNDTGQQLNTLSADLVLSQRTRWGATVTPWVGLSRFESLGLPQGDVQPPINSANLGLSMTQALLKGAGRNSAGSVERAAGLNVDASAHSSAFSDSQLAYLAVDAYWRLIAAQRQLTITKASEDRTQRLFNETQLLVETDQQPAADLDQVAASLSNSRAQVIQAGSTLLAAFEGVEMATGRLSKAERAQLDNSNAFPVLLSGDLSPALLDVQANIEFAMANRLDFRARSASLGASTALLNGVSHDRLPQLDLEMGLGFAGRADGAPFQEMALALGSQVQGLNGSAALSLQLPVRNRAAESNYLSQLATNRKLEIQIAESVREIEMEVRLAVDAMRSSLASLNSAQSSADFYRRAVDAERTKLRGGVATVIDVVLTEERLTNAELNHINARLRVAQSFTNFAFYTGRLPYQTGNIGSQLVSFLETGVWND